MQPLKGPKFPRKFKPSSACPPELPFRDLPMMVRRREEVDQFNAILAEHGAGSPQALKFKELRADDPEFCELAQVLEEQVALRSGVLDMRNPRIWRLLGALQELRTRN